MAIIPVITAPMAIHRSNSSRGCDCRHRSTNTQRGFPLFRKAPRDAFWRTVVSVVRPECMHMLGETVVFGACQRATPPCFVCAVREVIVRLRHPSPDRDRG